MKLQHYNLLGTFLKYLLTIIGAININERFSMILLARGEKGHSHKIPLFTLMTKKRTIVCGVLLRQDGKH
ncbi:hypothetical protein AQ687_24730 [Salmonella enterica subsp. enterica serovar Heidelberg]|nr:hypothetical protein [Salmonella enterica subsp. enterica serovar Heidelberg]